VKALVLPLVVVLSACVVIGSSTAAVALEPRAAPAAPLFAWVPADGFPDRFPFGQCTWWVAFNRRVTWGGNARDWLANAGVQGVAISATPTVGAIVAYRPGGLYSAFGHVAVVVAVTATTYTVSEMNAPDWGRVDARTIGWPDAAVEAFIPLDPRESAETSHPPARDR
jgi:hypothetical protein